MRALRLVFPSRTATPGPATLRAVVALTISTLMLAGCGKATVKSGSVREGFHLTDLQSGVSAVIVDAGVAGTDFTSSYRDALKERFGEDDSLSSYLATRLVDSLNGGTPPIAAVIAPGLNPRHILHVRDITIARAAREVPTALLPSGAQQNMQTAGGGTSESWTFSFEVDVWRPTGVLIGESEDSPGAMLPDSATSVREYSFSVTSRADVPLYAYKTALVEAINAAATEAARHLRSL